MDVSFGDDACRVRTDQAPANFATIEPLALNLLRRSTAKGLIDMKRHVASWDEAYLERLVRT
jgi:hypothetical protein